MTHGVCVNGQKYMGVIRIMCQKLNIYTPGNRFHLLCHYQAVNITNLIMVISYECERRGGADTLKAERRGGVSISGRMVFHDVQPDHSTLIGPSPGFIIWRR